MYEPTDVKPVTGETWLFIEAIVGNEGPDKNCQAPIPVVGAFPTRVAVPKQTV
jgi:hypothetical protein